MLIIALFADRFQVVFDAGFKTLNLTLRDTEAALNTYALALVQQWVRAGDDSNCY